jgi:hypothetical protein
MKVFKDWLKDIRNVFRDGLMSNELEAGSWKVIASESPVMDKDIADILDDDELRDKYLKRVYGSGSNKNQVWEPIIDVSDIIEELHKKRDLPKIREEKINKILNEQ